ncbi:hypothetical protein D3C77_34570 [compost metagenome]
MRFTQNDFNLYHDAILGRTTELLGKVFDHVKVTVTYEPCTMAIEVRATCVHRGRSYGRAQCFDVQCFLYNGPEFYSGYLRDRLPAEFARDIIDYIMRS